jgi:5-methyltetrahydropteroyltriglutamate--homocysteine methyltransferase
MLLRADRGERVERLRERVAEAVVEVVRAQLDAGLTTVNDGEAGRMSYATYVTGRLDGFATVGERPRSLPVGWEEFPAFFERFPKLELERPACVRPVSHRGTQAVTVDVENLEAACAQTGAEEVFVTAASPGVIAFYLENRHYPSHADYIWALAEAMAPEYEAICGAGMVLQLDCPDLTGPTYRWPTSSAACSRHDPRACRSRPPILDTNTSGASSKKFRCPKGRS